MPEELSCEPPDTNIVEIDDIRFARLPVRLHIRLTRIPVQCD